MKVTAKFRCIEKADRASSYGAPGAPTSGHVKLAAVQGPENKPWSQYTPCGSLDMQIDNPSALTAFEVGKDYLIEFTPAEETPKA